MGFSESGINRGVMMFEKSEAFLQSHYLDCKIATCAIRSWLAFSVRKSAYSVYFDKKHLIQNMIGKTIILLACAFMFIHGLPMEKDFIEINQEAGVADILTEGDMYIPQRSALDKSVRQWPNGVVPYTISSVFSYSDKEKIREALGNIMRAAPCLNFKEYTYKSSGVPKAHVEVFKSGGCWSMVGRTSSKQQLSLGSSGCLTPKIIMHEFLHAIGFYHEQSRPDRDQYVRINWNNVQGGREHNFNKASNINSLGVGYDRVSVMHYSSWAFNNGNGNKKTIEWIADPSLPLGGYVLSEKDIKQINLKYCSGPAPPTPPTITTTKKPTTMSTTTTTTKKPTTTTTTMKPTTKMMTTTKRTQPTTTTTTTEERTRPTMMTTTTQRPPMGACGDKSGTCISVQFSKSACSYSMKMKCPRSCGVCQGPKSEMCLNLKDTRTNCMEHAKAGMCQNKSGYKRWMMKTSCPRSCCERNELYKLPEY